MDLSPLYALVSVVMIDLVLAGDNAVVVGMAAAGLPLEQRQRVILIGVGLALLFRVAFAVVAVQLLAIIGLLLAGGLLLLWVAWKMWRELHAARAEEVGAEVVAGEAAPPPGGALIKTQRTAIVQIAIADVSMSLDNVLAVAGAARDHVVILIFGLVLSIALMALAASWIARLLTRHHWLAYIGLAIITVVALGMIWEGGEQVWLAVEEATEDG
jgi:YjbE family integral membrane protein